MIVWFEKINEYIFSANKIHLLLTPELKKHCNIVIFLSDQTRIVKKLTYTIQFFKIYR